MKDVLTLHMPGPEPDSVITLQSDAGAVYLHIAAHHGGPESAQAMLSAAQARELAERLTAHANAVAPEAA